MKHLSIILLSYNTRDMTKDCLAHLASALENQQSKIEIIVIDNASRDKSVEMIRDFKKAHKKLDLTLITNTKNVGFGAGNNEGLAVTRSKYILFLNSDIMVRDLEFDDLIYYMNKNPEVGVLTVRVLLPDGSVDPGSHRGFPTIWRSFTYFTGLEKLFSRFPKLTKFFGGYHLTHLDMETIHEIDSPNGAFYLTRKSILDAIGGFDTSFFMYGEDLDLSYRIKRAGYKIVYYPLFSVLHLKYKSGLKRGTKSTESATKQHFYEAMKIFYDKHFGTNNHRIKNNLVHFFIDLKKKL